MKKLLGTNFDMKKAVFLFMTLFCCILNASAQEQTTPEEYEVYKAWLAEPIIVGETKDIFLMKFTIDNRDDITDLPLSKKRQLFQLQHSTLEDYRVRNRKSLELKDNFDVSGTVHLIAEDWQNFWSGLAEADLAKKLGVEFLIAFSRVGFNKKRNQALMHVNYKSTSSKWAYGYYYLFSKQDGSWILTKGVKSWEY